MDEVAALFKVVIKVEPGVGGLGEFKAMGLVDKGTSFNALKKNGKSSLLAMELLSMLGIETVNPSCSVEG